MSKILKRPMFRRGGEVGGGIMSGIQTRTNLATAGFLSPARIEENTEMGGGPGRKMQQDYIQLMSGMSNPNTKVTNSNIGIPSIGLENRMGRYSKILRSALAPASSISPVAKFLITGGLKGLSQTGGGSTLANLAKAFEGPTGQLFTDLEAEGKKGQDIDLTAAQLAIKGEQAVEVEKEKARKTKFAAETFAERYRSEADRLVKSDIPPIKNNASNIANFKASNPDRPIVDLNFEYDRKAQKYVPIYSSLPVGAIAFDPTKGIAVTRNREGKIQFIDPFTFKAIPDSQVPGGQ